MTENLKRISAIVLASGLSRRMGQNKLLLDYAGKPVLAHVLDLLKEMDFLEKIIVTTPETSGMIEIPRGFKVIINNQPEKGQSESVKLGVGAAKGDYYMFFMGDMPRLGRQAALRIASLAEYGKIVVPYSCGNPVNPCVFPVCLKNDLLALKGDSGGRGLREAYAGICKTADFGETDMFDDVDTPDDYLRLPRV